MTTTSRSELDLVEDQPEALTEPSGFVVEYPRRAAVDGAMNAFSAIDIHEARRALLLDIATKIQAGASAEDLHEVGTQAALLAMPVEDLDVGDLIETLAEGPGVVVVTEPVEACLEKAAEHGRPQDRALAARLIKAGRGASAPEESNDARLIAVREWLEAGGPMRESDGYRYNIAENLDEACTVTDPGSRHSRRATSSEAWEYLTSRGCEPVAPESWAGNSPSKDGPRPSPPDRQARAVEEAFMRMFQAVAGHEASMTPLTTRVAFAAAVRAAIETALARVLTGESLHALARGLGTGVLLDELDRPDAESIMRENIIKAIEGRTVPSREASQ